MAVPPLPTTTLIDVSTQSAEERFPAAVSPALARGSDPVLPATMQTAVDLPSREKSHQTPLLTLPSSEPTTVRAAQVSPLREPRIITPAGQTTVASAGQKRLDQTASSRDDDDRLPPPQLRLQDMTKTVIDGSAASACPSERESRILDDLQPELPSLSSIRGGGDAWSLVQQPVLPLASAVGVCQNLEESNPAAILPTSTSTLSVPPTPTSIFCVYFRRCVHGSS